MSRGPEARRRFLRDLPSPVGAHPLDPFLTPERRSLYRQVLARRTGRLVVVVEDCHDPHNATAVVRTCDACGVHRVVVTTARNSFKINREISQGSHHYVRLDAFPDITAAYAALRAEGFRIAVTDLAADAAIGPQALLPIVPGRPLAIVFGSEKSGVSVEAVAGSDQRFLIPMSGFAQSLNLSVSVAMSVYALRAQALCDDAPGDLSDVEQAAAYDAWAREHKPKVAAALGKQGEALDVIDGSARDGMVT